MTTTPDTPAPAGAAAALVRAQREFGAALKTSANPAFKSRYADLAACLEAVAPALHRHGLALLQRTHPDAEGVAVETLLIHETGDTISGGVLRVPAAKRDPQGFGSALTYARRYSLMSTCGIAAEDDDGNAAAQAMQPRTQRQPSQATARATAPTPAQRAQAVTDRVRAGDAAGAAAELAALSGDALGPIWERLDHDTAEALRAAWPDA
ncbi:MAG: hypothetical protein RL456_623 [Pseudomonadota bacterium]|jgi:hypothetical protein